MTPPSYADTGIVVAWAFEYDAHGEFVRAALRVIDKPFCPQICLDEAPGVVRRRASELVQTLAKLKNDGRIKSERGFKYEVDQLVGRVKAAERKAIDLIAAPNEIEKRFAVVASDFREYEASKGGLLGSGVKVADAIVACTIVGHRKQENRRGPACLVTTDQDFTKTKLPAFLKDQANVVVVGPQDLGKLAEIYPGRTGAMT